MSSLIKGVRVGNTDYLIDYDSLANKPNLDNKQNKITGTSGDFVVIGEDGNVTTRSLPIAEEADF